MGTEESEDTKDTDDSSSYSLIYFSGNDIPECYRGLIYSRWLRSNRYGNLFFKMTISQSYYQHHKLRIDSILNHQECAVKLAVLSDDHDVVLGFSVSRNEILDYVHVHYVQRLQKIASNLVPKNIKCVTHWTYQGERFLTKRYGGFTLDPYA
jgi:hypothetical protein